MPFHKYTLFLIFLTTAAARAGTDSDVTRLDPVIVTDQLDVSRESILPSLGATSFIMDQQQIQNLPQGEDAPFSAVLLNAPGVAQDSAANGDLHVRGEHANLQYRINDVLLPEGISGFGLELDTRFVNSMQLITGSLPAQYGFRTAGIVDIQTKSGALDEGGSASLYAGSFGTVRPSLEVSGSNGKTTYFADATYDHDGIGIENPTSSSDPVHDLTDQYKAFTYISHLLDSTSRLSFMGSVSYSTFEIPDTPGLAAGTAPDGRPWLPGAFSSSGLNENQSEQNAYGVVAYQKAAGDLNLQLSAFARESGVHFTPDPVGDLYFNGVASDVDRRLASVGLQADGSYATASNHTLRSGFSFLDETVRATTDTTVFPVDSLGNPTGPAYPIAGRQSLRGLFAGAYLQDEWTLARGLTLNWGGRADTYRSTSDNESQLSPRVNLIYQVTPSTTLHAGYSRYFTPPPVENVPAGTVAQFDGTSNQSEVTRDDPVKAERSDYFDAGVSQKLTRHLQVGIDGYYKKAKDQLDDGLFGQTLILSAFNYAKGEIYGVELSGTYTDGAFTSYLNLAHSVATGEDWVSSQFLFSPDDLAYVSNHSIFLDHDQALTASFGASYHWDQARGSTRLFADVIYGTGLRQDSTTPDGTTIPNGGTVPAHYTVSIGAEQTLRISNGRSWKLRVDVLNLTDEVYELRSGSGVGVNAPQYGMRRGFFGSAAFTF